TRQFQSANRQAEAPLRMEGALAPLVELPPVTYKMVVKVGGVEKLDSLAEVVGDREVDVGPRVEEGTTWESLKKIDPFFMRWSQIRLASLLDDARVRMRMVVVLLA